MSSTPRLSERLKGLPWNACTATGMISQESSSRCPSTPAYHSTRTPTSWADTIGEIPQCRSRGRKGSKLKKLSVCSVCPRCTLNNDCVSHACSLRGSVLSLRVQGHCTATKLLPHLVAGGCYARSLYLDSHATHALILICDLEPVKSSNCVQETNEPINPATTTARYIPWGIQHEAVQNVKEFRSNAVSTAKYDQYFITFIPRFLFEMFSRVAYLYFLIQVRMRLYVQ
jgi:Phospholipid-translocating ATPase N-terminal